MFTAQHYYVVSRLLRRHYSYVNWSTLIYDFTKLFKEDNEKFDERKFRLACIPKVLKRMEKEEEKDANRKRA